MYVIDAEGRAQFINRAIAEFVGYEAEEMVGTELTEHTREDDAERAEELIAELLEDDERSWASFEMCIVHADGSTTRCEDKIAVITDEDGNYRGTTGVIRDISDRKERERRLEEFASVVSHDLRSPLNVVQGRVELARETGETEHLAAVERAADRMERLIGDLLTLARQGEGVGDREPVDVGVLARGCWGAVDTGLAVLQLDDPGTIEADPERLRGVFENLFRNAIEHGDGDDDPVTVRVGRTDAGFFVEDDGPGIPENRREDVFDRGFTTSEDGTGFGLAIVADIVEAHGWTIEVTEGRDGGARFEIAT
jgi:PAS domain S-box-containing protein